jgi:hypothetical protein
MSEFFLILLVGQITQPETIKFLDVLIERNVFLLFSAGLGNIRCNVLSPNEGKDRLKISDEGFFSYASFS